MRYNKARIKPYTGLVLFEKMGYHKKPHIIATAATLIH